MKIICVLTLLLISSPLMAMNIGSGLYRFDFEVSLVVFVVSMLAIGHFPEIKRWLIHKHHAYLESKKPVRSVDQEQ